MAFDFSLVALAGATLALALIAGVFLAFSDFVMRSLDAAPPVAGIAAMQQINRKVYGSVFLVGLLGMAPVSAGLAAWAWAALPSPARGWIVAGAAIYLTGTVLVTMLGNVPMNRRLDGMAPDGAATAAYWRHYASVWTRWNHLRTAAAVLAAWCFLLGGLHAV